MDEYMSFERLGIEVSEVDYMGEYQLCHLFNEFSKIATSSASQIGLWKDEMIDQYGWVVAKQTLHLDEPIHVNDNIVLSTTIGNGRFAAFPRFYFIDKDNQQIGYCSSLWTLIDIRSRRITSPKKIGLDVPEVEKNLHALPQNIVIDIPLDFIMTRKVLYSDVDTNQHMNNTRYIQWALDVIDFDIHKDYFVSDLSVQYKREIRPQEDVYLFLGQNQERYIIEGRNQDNEVYFTVEVIFKKR